MIEQNIFITFKNEAKERIIQFDANYKSLSRLYNNVESKRNYSDGQTKDLLSYLIKYKKKWAKEGYKFDNVSFGNIF